MSSSLSTLALDVRHTNLLISEVLDPTWGHVFSQFEESFRIFGERATWDRVLVHRTEMMRWVRQIAHELEPLRLTAQHRMPPIAKGVSGHVHIP